MEKLEKSEYIHPNTSVLQTEYLVKYGQEFLRLNNLTVGQIAEFDFPYEKVSTKYKSRELEKYSYKKRVPGILKLDEHGRLYAESIDDLVFYEYESNNYSGRSRKSWYREVKKKSVINFGKGFIY